MSRRRAIRPGRFAPVARPPLAATYNATRNMALAPGTRFGVHQIAERIGAGGMGEVYRARDTVLDRDIALKVLPDQFVRDPERLIRFDREAKTLASLNHPNVAQVYGVETTDGVRAIVMELVPGEDLRERLGRGAMPIDEVLPVARQVAEALDVAHASGVVHRDLKPANIKIRPDGTVKVLDFGLAKLASGDGQDCVSAALNSPTMTSPMTQAGMILGTAAYMAPEQAKGRAVDKRADVWAFGCVLYEMLSGEALFAATDVSETLANVLRQEVQWSRLPAATPEPIRRLLRRCLVRDPRQRLSDLSVARFEIDDAQTGTGAAVPPARSRVGLLAATAAAAGIALGAVAATSWLGQPAALPTRVVQVTSGETINYPQISPDGQAVAYVAGERERIVVRSLATGEDRELPDTDRAVNLFWSPDSGEVAYFTNRDLGWELRAVPANGGASRVVVGSALDPDENAGPSPVSAGAWCAAGIVYFEGNPRGLRLVSRAGQLLQTFETTAGGGTYGYPHCLPDGRVLAVRRGGPTNSIVVITPTQQITLLEVPASNPVTVRFPVLVGPTHIVFERREPTAGLWVLPVKPDLSGKSGEERLIVPHGVRPSAAGTLLAYVSGLRSVGRQLVWVDRKGTRLGTFGRHQGEFKSPSLSPDATQVITGGRRGLADELWLQREDTVQRWIETERGDWPAWSPKGDLIAYTLTSQPRELIVRSVNGSNPRTVTTGRGITQLSWTPKGDALVYAGDGGVWLAPLAGGTPRRILENAREPSVSPDGRMLAYSSAGTGKREVYVTTFPATGQGSPVSIDGGRYPLWTASGELFFACGPPSGEGPGALRALCNAAMHPSHAVRRGPPETLFDVVPRDLLLITYGQRGYDISRDGSRILVQTDGVIGTPAITLVENSEAWLRASMR
jgi:Tol biopolymer transport system component/tRNA A-37 threonylcarbamoyl transferase component Bud32